MAKTQKINVAPVTDEAEKVAFEAAKAESGKKVSKAIERVAKAGKVLEADAHEAAMEVLKHADKYRDVTGADRLIAALPGMARKNALKAWFIHYGKFKWNSTKKTFTFNKNRAESDIEAAQAQPFWEFIKEPEFRPFDLESRFKALVKAANDAKADERNKVPDELLAKINALA